MNERAIFMEALEKDTAQQRAAFLDEACGSDKALRRQVEALLRSHEQAGSFLGKPAPQRLAEQLPTPDEASDTQSEAPVAGGAGLPFLAPASQPGGLGRLGHYEVLEVVGKGGMGIVLKAFDEKLRRVVAIKALAPALASTGSARQRFVREARAAAAVTHDNVIAIHAVENAGPVPYLVMQ